MKRLLLISTWFQVIWLMAVIGNSEWVYITGLLVSVTYVVTAVKGNVEWSKLAVVIVVGVMLDYFHMAVGWFQFEPQSFPIWLVLLWAIFAWYAYFLSPILNQYPIVPVSMVGGIAGALSYVAGAKLGAVSLSLSLPVSGFILFVEWSLLIALILRVYGHETTSSCRAINTDDQ
ncbi:DUF2878 domain-containing protein [Vibrio aquaticus]|uniref:DUF2878 domain-containing protein n=1 Tax=Vibrio aquaticus TaxID=2496559 RepID=A0A432CXM0_9VIBR|nr:DUF2878 domain-containing protein [Vibrio aquaticus]RTZ15641.1 DUF2878 domain-containing protein [Vibrio aquaticus]